MSPDPATLAVPEQLADLRRWLVWRAEERNGKLSKIPYRADGHGKASSTDSSSWSDLPTALAAVESFDGLGIALGDGLAGVDLDRCVVDDRIAPWAQEIIDALDSYAEFSPSGSGVHVLILGELTRDRHRRDLGDGHIEVYSQGRYFTFTGDHVPGTPVDVNPRQEELDALHLRLFPEPETPPAPEPEPEPEQVGTTSDAELLAKMFAAKNGAKVRALFDGDTSAYPSASEADEALCCHLAFWTAKDPVAIDRLFRLSGLYRPKWEERADYRDDTIRKAIDLTTEVYAPKRKRGRKHVGDAEAGEAALGELTQADALLFMAEASIIELFAEAADATPYAQVETPAGVATWPVRSAEFRGWLLRRFREELGATPSTTATEQAVRQLEAEALDGPRRALHLRAAWDGADLLIDRGGPEWSAFRVTAGGWTVDHRPPPVFRRHAGLEPYPDPGAGGDLADIFDFVPVADDRDRLLLLTWLVAALVPDVPRPVLLLTGPQGSGKSTAARLLRRLIDPSALELLRRPRDESDILQALAHNFCCPFDNLTSLPTWCSDILCAAVTGVASVKRRLYSDQEDTIFKLRRLVVLNGVANVAHRPDLLDRALHVQLARIAEPRPEADLIAAFDAARPALLGALLDALAETLRLRPTLSSAGSTFRMADFALLGRAAAVALGYGEADFIDAYTSSVADRNEEAIDADPFAAAVVSLLTDPEGGDWQGTASDLLREAEAEAIRVSLDTSPEAWPQSARAAANRLREAVVNLAAVGVVTEFKRAHGRKLIRLRAKVE